MNVKGKNIIITGGSLGIGRETARELVAKGANVLITGRSKARLLEAKSYTQSKIIEFDISDHKNMVENAKKCMDILDGRIDVLINNAGITRDSLILRMKNHQWDDVLNTNLNGAFYATKSVLRSMMKNKYGRIINITSIVGLQGNSGQSNYSASKAGLIGFSQSVAKEVASRGITINCIAPGWIETEMTSDLPQDIKSEIIKSIPIGKTGTTEDIAVTALFLASEESKYITGQTITVDGGRIIN